MIFPILSFPFVLSVFMVLFRAEVSNISTNCLITNFLRLEEYPLAVIFQKREDVERIGSICTREILFMIQIHTFLLEK